MKELYKPQLFRLSNFSDLESYSLLKISKPNLVIYDTIDEQLIDLYKVRNPDKLQVNKDELKEFIISCIGSYDIEKFGVWVFYPWSNRLVHVLDENDFFEVRTNRNNNKITLAEQLKLKNKTVGIVGLSVGQSVALTIAMERICGKLRLADFDTIELSNLNRIRTSVHNLGLSKVVAVAREIAEIDPFIDVEIFPEGLSDDNMQDFFVKDNCKLDVLLELCDGLDIKLKSRVTARSLGIPVVMETNDRCMVDIERFDLEPNRGILHGLINEDDLTRLNDLNPQERISLVLKIVDQGRLSAQMTEAFSLLGKTIRSWPQLASSVTTGAGITTDIVRKILLGQQCFSGRWYFDIDEILNTDSIDFELK